MALLLIFLSAVISCYWYLTDPTRIRQMSQAYLSELIGGQVEIGSASLTIFEGLNLSNVSVKVDKTGKADDTTVFFADDIEIQYNPASLLRGRLEATRIIATGAKVKLVEDSVAGRWNYQRLSRPTNKSSATRPENEPPKPLLLPQLVLRDGRVIYSEVKGAAVVERGQVGIEGKLYPSRDNSLYSFELQSRGAREGVGPVVAGEVSLKTGHVSATLNHMHFGPDIEAMLPREVRDFWTAHKVAGALEINKFNYTPATQKNRAAFNLTIDLENVKLIVRSEEFDPPPQFEPLPIRSGALPWDLVAKLQDFSLQARRMVHWMHIMPQRPPIAVNDVTGEFIFNERGFQFNKVIGTIADATLPARSEIDAAVEGYTLAVSGNIEGYSPDAPIWLRVESLPHQVVTIKQTPEILPSLPGPLHQIYNMIKPHGQGTFWAEFHRASSTDIPQVTGELNITDGAFDCIFFPYPIHGAQGKVVFTPDPTHTIEKITLENIHGHGIPGGPNENGTLYVSGWVNAMDTDASCHIQARAKGMKSEPALFAAFPPPVRKVMDIFRGPGADKSPYFAGDFDCTVVVPMGLGARPVVSVDLNFTDGRGKMTAFPYPLEQLTGKVFIRDGYLDVQNVNLRHNNTNVAVNGRVTWPTGLPDKAEVIARPALKLTVRDMPLNDELLRVLPIEASSWLHSVGATGTLNVDGIVHDKPNATAAADSIAYDLDIAMRDGTARPQNSDYKITDAAGNLRVHTDRLEVLDLHGKRGNAALSGTGTVNWAAGDVEVQLSGQGKGLTLEPALRDLLPPDAKSAWVSLDPHGALDADVLYHGTWSASKPQPVASLAILPDAISPPPQPTKSDFRVTLHPVDVSATATVLPYRLDHCTGEITITPADITVAGIHASHGKAHIDLTGKGLTSNPNDWDISLKAQNVPVDDELKKALPPQIRSTLAELKYTGDVSLDLKSMRYRGDKPEADIDLSGTLTAANGAIDVGVPMEKIQGEIPFDAAVRNGKLAAFSGEMAINQMNMADRPITNLNATLNMAVGSDVLRLTGIHGGLAGGEVAGQMDLKFPDAGPSSYLMNFAVKNADLREMSKQVAPRGQEIRGQVSASLAMQGEWANPATRQGRGDVLVNGKEMYQIPLMLGLLEVTNLQLTRDSSFNEGTARYMIEGNRVTFEQVQMRSNSIVMNGDGWLDFGSKQVRMNFTTENPNIPQIPLVHDLLKGARQELLQIQVRGTVQSPKVSAASLHTFTTTVDEVLTGNGKEK